MIKDKKLFKFLIIEDDPGDLVIIEDFIREEIEAPVIITAYNYKQAAEILTKERGFSALLMDLRLPDKEGQELVTSILAITPISCPVIILTGFANIEFSIKSITQGILDYLFKNNLTAAALYKSIIYAIERTKNIAAIKASEKRYSDLFNLSPQPMWVFDPMTFQFTQVNKATIDLYGYTEDEFLSMGLWGIFNESDWVEIKESIKSKQPGDGMIKGLHIINTKSKVLLEMEIYSNSITLNDKDMIAVIAIDVTEKNQIDQQVVKAIIKAQEDERYEIGGELHDNVSQILAMSQLSLGMLKDFVAPAGFIKHEQCREYILLAIEEIRNLSHRLAPAFLEYSTLEEAFSTLLHSFNMGRSYKVALHFDNAFATSAIPEDLQLNLYRILQEQLKNIQKYSHAGLVEVDVIIYNNKLKMRIADNGIGFNVDAVKGGIGMANMKRRTELFLGKFNTYSSPGKGCVIVVDVPLMPMATSSK